MQFVCYTRCGTCQKAKKYLTEHEISYEERDIKTENPTAEELSAWIKIQKVFQYQRKAV